MWEEDLQETKMKYLTILAIVLLAIIAVMLGIVSATPQVIFSNINLTIEANSTSLYYKINGEGVSASEILSLNLNNATNFNFSLYRNQIPITFSRDVCENLDVAVLIRALTSNLNITDDWRTCVTRLSVCEGTRLDATNSSSIKTQLDYCNNAAVTKDASITTKDLDIKNLESQRLLFGAIGIAGAGLAWHFYKKNTPKTLTTPGLSQLPRSQRI